MGPMSLPSGAQPPEPSSPQELHNEDEFDYISVYYSAGGDEPAGAPPSDTESRARSGSLRCISSLYIPAHSCFTRAPLREAKFVRQELMMSTLCSNTTVLRNHIRVSANRMREHDASSIGLAGAGRLGCGGLACGSGSGSDFPGQRGFQLRLGLA